MSIIILGKFVFVTARNLPAKENSQARFWIYAHMGKTLVASILSSFLHDVIFHVGFMQMDTIYSLTAIYVSHRNY